MPKKGLITDSPKNLHCKIKKHARIFQTEFYSFKGFFCPDCYTKELSEELRGTLNEFEKELERIRSWDKRDINSEKSTDAWIKKYRRKLEKLESGKIQMDVYLPPKFLGYECPACNGIVRGMPDQSQDWGRLEKYDMTDAINWEVWIHDCRICGTRLGVKRYRI